MPAPQPDRWSMYDAFQAAYTAYSNACKDFDKAILAMVESGTDTNERLDLLVLDLDTKHRRFMELAKPFVR